MLKTLARLLFPNRYESMYMLDNYLHAQYGPFLRDTPTHTSEDFYRHLVDIARPYIEHRTRALDIGCATGRLVFEYSLLGARSATGIDSSELFIEACERIRKGTEERIRYVAPATSTSFVCADIMAHGTTDNTYDFISCINVIDRVDDPSALIDKISSITATSGILLLVDPYDWEISPAPYERQVSDVKTLLLPETWDILSESHLDFLMPLDQRKSKKYQCHVVIARRK